jgi:hypothetical protein
MTMSFFEGMQTARTRRVLNVLLEAPFFYVEDDPELFAYLRRHRTELARFFLEVFDWQLVVETSVARVHKSEWHNDAITKKRRGTFEPTRPGECIALLVLLDLHDRLRSTEGELSRPRVTMGALLQHAAQRLAELGLQDRYDETTLRGLYRDLVPTLMRHRLVRELEERQAGGDSARTYELLPGLGLYDARALSDEAIRDAFDLGRASS